VTSLLKRADLEAHAAEQMELLFQRVPKAREFHAGQFMDPQYYRRHVLETLLRIELNNEVDAYCLYRIGSTDNGLASLLSRYLSEEYGHDGMFLRDLLALGMTEEEVRASSPFFTTHLLIGYMYHAINHDGPMPTMVWNWFVEWYSDRYNGVITAKAAEEFGADRVRGSSQHIEVDEDEDHAGLMFATVAHMATDEQSVRRATDYLTRFVWLVGEYFGELYESTCGEIADDVVAPGVPRMRVAYTA
jgi:hypothetical protein